MRKSTGEFGGAWAGEGVIETVQGADVDMKIPIDFYVWVPRVPTQTNLICWFSRNEFDLNTNLPGIVVLRTLK